MRHRLLKPLIKSVKLVWRVAGQGRSDIHHQPAFRQKPKMLAFEIAKALRDQTGCDQQRNRECNLCYDQ